MNFEPNISFWPEWKSSDSWKKKILDKTERRYWEKIFDRVANGEINSWAYPWIASTWYKGGITITPNTNLVSNIGFGEDSTHTSNKDSEFSNMPLKALGKLKHPKEIYINVEADNWTFNFHFGGKAMRFPHNILSLYRRSISFILRS